jgi:hypothetical protein
MEVPVSQGGRKLVPRHPTIKKNLSFFFAFLAAGAAIEEA